jgi:organic hydroperoxide reductase OsmC/OhrA
MPSPFPHRYRVGLVREGRHSVLTDGVKPALIGGPPPEFGGSPEWWSPEHLLLSAVSLCFAATFESLALRGGLTVDFFESEARGVLDRTSMSIEFVSVALHVSLRVAPGQSELGDRLLASAKRHCIVANSLKVPIDLVATVGEEKALPA